MYCSKVAITITNGSEYTYYCMKHEKGQSKHSFQMDRSKSFQIYHKNKGYAEYLVQTETTLLKKSNYDCVEDNSFSFKDCINEFISDQIGCNLPWAKSGDGMRQCTIEQDLVLFRNVSIDLTSQESRRMISRKGCFKHNCRKTTWTKNLYDEKWDNSWKNEMVVYMNVPATATVMQRKEVLLVDFSTFLADCGSYLSLFLGASVLSLTDIIISISKRTSMAVSNSLFLRKK